MISKFINFIRHRYEFIFKIILFFITSCSIIFLLPKKGKFKYEYQYNKPWVHEDLLAPFDFAINKTSDELDKEKKEIINHHLFYFNLNSSVKDKKRDEFLNWLSKNWSDTLKIGKQNLYQKAGIAYLDSIYNKGIIEITDFLEHKSGNYSIILMGKNNVGEQVEIGNYFTVKSAYDYVAEDLDNHQKINKPFLLAALENFITQNITFNKELTDKDLESELNNVSLVSGGIYEKQKIISKGEIVTSEKFKILNSLKQQYESNTGLSSQSFWITVGQSLLVLIMMYTIFIFLKNVGKEVYNSNLNIVFISILMLGFISLTIFVLQFETISVYIIPFCIIPLLIRTFFGNRIALFIYLITIFIISFFVPNSFEFALLEIITGIVTIFTVLNVNKRAELFYTSFLIFFVFSLIYFGFALIQEGNFNNISWKNFGSFAIAAGLSLLTYPLIYIFEKLFGYISDVTLLELSDTNNKLLRELNLKAPGTFQHSLQVANLAEEAIREVGGNPLLVRTGALYHDIGKMKAPAFFIENQTSGINPHDELSYEESASVIINHVIYGIELAKKNKLPDQIIDFIRTHHGTTKTQYFLKMYTNENPDEEIDETIYQYPGPIPYSKETAALMMADSVEAASRSLKVYDNQTITNLVEGIIDYQMKENQFANSDITFKDINVIKKMFIKKLMNIYHVRIEYPK